MVDISDNFFHTEGAMSPGILSDMLLLHVLAYLAGVGGKSCISHAAYS